jgi:translation initiation factor 2 beta subunit (eIF-2beta)/eIF-5
MTTLNRTIVLNSLIKHETLTIVDIRKAENLGMIPDKVHLNFLLNELMESGHVDTLNGVLPLTYMITTDEIAEGEKLSGIA